MGHRATIWSEPLAAIHSRVARPRKRLVKANGLLSGARTDRRRPARLPQVSEDGGSLLEQLDALDVVDIDTPFPFAQLSTPVYSLSTNGTASGEPASMNIVTYATPTSLSPRTFAVGLYRNTLTWQNFLDSRTGVLQILRCKHLPLVQLLGHSSGNSVDKLARIKEMGFGVSQFFGQSVISDCYGLVELELISKPVTVGDHDVVICQVGAYMTNRKDADDILTTAHLRDAGLMATSAKSR